MTGILLYLVPAIVLLGFFGLYTVQQQSIAVIQRFGKFVRIGNPGLNIRIPIIETIAGRLSLRVNQLDVKVETKTEDNVFLHVTVSVQFYIRESTIYEAFYKLSDPARQITSFVFDVVRARVPRIKLDDVFEKKDEIANAVKEELTEMMGEFGYGILKALVTDIDPDAKVKEAMNEINAAQRLRVAANEKGEAEKILKVKSAEAISESMILEGHGVAGQRKAIVDGFRESINDFNKSLPDCNTGNVMNLILMTQYFDMLRNLSDKSNHSTILIPHSPGAVSDLSEQIRNSVITANQIGKLSESIKSQKPLDEDVTNTAQKDELADKLAMANSPWSKS